MSWDPALDPDCPTGDAVDAIETAPAAFEHAPKDMLLHLEGETAPVKTHSKMFYADALLEPGAMIPLPDTHEDRGVYVLTGAVTVAGETFEAGQMMVFRPGDAISLRAGDQGARIMLLSGATLEGPRHVWWNFVASSKDRIDAAKEAWRAGDWAHGRFRLPPGDDAEFIPLPAL